MKKRTLLTIFYLVCATSIPAIGMNRACKSDTDKTIMTWCIQAEEIRLRQGIKNIEQEEILAIHGLKEKELLCRLHASDNLLFYNDYEAINHESCTSLAMKTPKC